MQAGDLFRIATWNINSVRLRIGLVEKFLTTERPDVLCLQETKCRDSEFPAAAFHELGYRYTAIHGQKGYHGVAVVSRVPFAEIEKKKFCGIDDARHITVCFDRSAIGADLEIHNLYVPAGGDVPDRSVNAKFGHKLDFVDELCDWSSAQKLATRNSIVLGDLNIAPLENDVWNHKAMLKVVSHTPVEVEKLANFLASGPWTDAMRRIVPDTEKLYTWWSYRSPDWARADKGRRLDHLWLSQSLVGGLRDVRVLKGARGWERPSDHAPAIVELAL